MSWNQRAIVVALIIIATASWGVGLRAALLPGAAETDQPSMEGTAVAEAPLNETTVSPTLATVTTTAVDATEAPVTATSTPWDSIETPVTPTNTPWPTMVAPTSTPLPTKTPTRPPSPTPSITANATEEPLVSPLPSNSERFLLVDQDAQMMHVYEDGVLIRSIPVSTGIPVANAFTPAWRGKVGRYWGGGPFRNSDLWSDYMWYLFPGARGSILIHSVPYSRDGGLKLYDQLDALGVEPASHGCVRISPEDAQWLQVWDPVNVPIEITPWSGEIGPPDDSL